MFYLLQAKKKHEVVVITYQKEKQMQQPTLRP